jgi:hypothetical protein
MTYEQMLGKREMNTADRYAFWNEDTHSDEYKRLLDVSHDDLISEYGAESSGQDRCCHPEESRHNSNNLNLLRTEILRRMMARDEQTELTEN